MTTARELIEQLQEIGHADPTRLDLEIRLFGAKGKDVTVRYVSDPLNARATGPYVHLRDFT